MSDTVGVTRSFQRATDLGKEAHVLQRVAHALPRVSRQRVGRFHVSEVLLGASTELDAQESELSERGGLAAPALLASELGLLKGVRDPVEELGRGS